MRIKESLISFLGLVISQVIVTCIVFFSIGTNHPFKGLYQVGNPLFFILAAIAIVAPLYIICGFFFVLGSNKRRNLQRSLLNGCFYYAVIIIALWGLCNVLTITNIMKNAWEIYIILNFPTGVIINNIDIVSDALNPLFLLTAIIPSIFFYLGGYLRIRFLKVKGLIRS